MLCMTTEWSSLFSLGLLSCSPVASGASTLKLTRIFSNPTAASFEIPSVSLSDRAPSVSITALLADMQVRQQPSYRYFLREQLEQRAADRLKRLVYLGLPPEHALVPYRSCGQHPQNTRPGYRSDCFWFGALFDHCWDKADIFLSGAFGLLEHPSPFP